MTKSNGGDLSDYSMLDLFRMEVETQVELLSNELLNTDPKNLGQDVLEKFMRAAHSIKGAARMVDINSVVRVSHVVEDCFVAAQKGKLILQRAHMDKLLSAIDFISSVAQQSDKAMLSSEKKMEATIVSLEADLRHLISPPKAKPEKSKSAPQVAADGEATQYNVEEYSFDTKTFRIAATRLDRILTLAGEALVESHRHDNILSSFWQYKHKQFSLVEKIDSLRNMFDDLKLSEAQRAQLNGLSRFAISLRQELSNNLASLEALGRRSASITEKLHNEILASRMRPFSELVQGLPRMVRELGRRLHKNITLEMNGLSTLVDKEVLERIDTALKHLIQNAADHGIEKPEQRQKKGKPDAGVISIAVSQSAGMLFITVSDDGDGVDFAMLKQKIVARNLASADDLEKLDEMAMLDFLFMPGFSTRNTVTKLSGRGVGLDVVKEAVVTLGGSVHAASQMGKGTSFQMLVPLKVSVIRALIVTIGGESYGLPLARNYRVFRLRASDIEEENGQQYFALEENKVRLIHANEVFGQSFDKFSSENLPVVVLGEQAPFYGVVVERIIGEQELALQRLDSYLGKIRDISAAALLQDGSLALVVDSEEFVRSVEYVFNGGYSKPVCDTHKMVSLAALDVLVVDDSMTAREMEKKVLTAYQCDVKVATNGAEAFAALEHHDFDFLVSDIDMPVMDGLTLVKKLRASEKYRTLPVLLLSHRERSELDENILTDGYTHYFSKSEFSKARFIDEVTQLLAHTLYAHRDSE